MIPSCKFDARYNCVGDNLQLRLPLLRQLRREEGTERRVAEALGVHGSFEYSGAGGGGIRGIKIWDMWNPELLDGNVDAIHDIKFGIIEVLWWTIRTEHLF